LKRLPVVITVLVGLFLTACGQGEATPAAGVQSAPIKIRLGSIPTSGLAVMHVISQPPTGLQLPNTGAYDLEVTQFSGSPEIQQGLATKTLDAGAVGAAAIFPALKQGIGLKVTGELMEERKGWLTSAWMVRKDSGISSLADLRGKTVATNSVGSPVYWTGKGHLDDIGLSPNKDYKVVAVPFANMEKALSAGQVDLAPMIMPFAKAARESGKYNVLFEGTDELNPSVQSLLVFSQDFIDQHRDTVKAFMKDWAAAAEFVRDPANHDAVVEAVAKVTNAPPAALQYVATQDFYYIPENGAPNVESIQLLWDWMVQVGGTDKAYKIEDYLDKELLPGS
jgi:NitT/TauT family transport system substrate-binding protein